MALKFLRKVKPVGLQVLWTKTKVPLFRGMMNDTVHLVLVCSKDIEVSCSLTYLGGVVHNNGDSCQEIT